MRALGVGLAAIGLAVVVSGCSGRDGGGGGSTPCGTTTCSSGQVCCSPCGGAPSCYEGTTCPEAQCDAGGADSGPRDAARPDAHAPDASSPDASASDGSTPDATAVDATMPEGGAMSCGDTVCSADLVCCVDCTGHGHCVSPLSGSMCPVCEGGLPVDAGPRSDAGPLHGCADGSVTCPSGQMCCEGVPYPPEGECAPDCPLVSDRNVKTDFTPVDPDAMLARLAALPVSEWSYRAQAGHVRHVGPMAQDFRATFHLGSSDRTIHPIDEAGVTIAALQALNRKVEALSAADHRLERDNASLRAQVHALSARLLAAGRGRGLAGGRAGHRAPHR